MVWVGRRRRIKNDSVTSIAAEFSRLAGARGRRRFERHGRVKNVFNLSHSPYTYNNRRSLCKIRRDIYRAEFVYKQHLNAGAARLFQRRDGARPEGSPIKETPSTRGTPRWDGSPSVPPVSAGFRAKLLGRVTVVFLFVRLFYAHTIVRTCSIVLPFNSRCRPEMFAFQRIDQSDNIVYRKSPFDLLFILFLFQCFKRHFFPTNKKLFFTYTFPRHIYTKRTVVIKRINPADSVRRVVSLKVIINFSKILPYIQAS